MDYKGHKRRTERAIELYREWYALLNDPVNPLTVAEIAQRYEKKNGDNYTNAGIYYGLKKLSELGII